METPRSNSSEVSCDSRLMPPRILNAPSRWWFFVLDVDLAGSGQPFESDVAVKRSPNDVVLDALPRLEDIDQGGWSQRLFPFMNFATASLNY